MKLRKVLACLLSLALLASSVAVAGIIPAAAASLSTKAGMIAGDIIPTTLNYLSGATFATTKGDLDGRVNTLSDGVVYGLTPHQGSTDKHYTITNIGSNTEFCLTADFGSAKSVTTLEVCGIQGAFTGMYIPGYTLYLTNDPTDQSKWTEVGSASESDCQAEIGYIFTLNEAITARYLILKSKTYSGQPHFWISELGAMGEATGPAPIIDEDEEIIPTVDNGGVAGAEVLSTDTVPSGQSVIQGRTATKGTTGGAFSLSAGSQENLTNGNYPGLNEKIEAVRDASGNLKNINESHPEYGIVTTTNDILTVINNATDYADVTFDMGVVKPVTGFAVGSTAETNALTKTAAASMTDQQITDALNTCAQRYVRLHKGDFFISENLDDLYNEENKVSAWDYSLLGTRGAATPLVAEYGLKKAAEGRYVGFRLYIDSGWGWYSQIRIGELAVFSDVENKVTAITKDNVPTATNLLAGLTPTKPDGTGYSLSYGKIEELSDGHWQGVDIIPGYVTTSTQKTVSGKLTEPVPGEPGQYFDYESWGFAKTTGNTGRAVLVAEAANGTMFGLTYDLGESFKISEVAIGSSFEPNSWQIGNAPATEQAYNDKKQDWNAEVIMYKGKVYVSNDKATLYDAENCVIDYDYSGNKKAALCNLWTLAAAKTGRYVGFEFPTYQNLIRISELGVYGKSSVDIDFDSVEITKANANLIPAENLLHDRKALDGEFRAIEDAGYEATCGFEANGIIGGITQDEAEAKTLVSSHGDGASVFVYTLSKVEKISKVWVAGLKDKAPLTYEIYAAENSADLFNSMIGGAKNSGNAGEKTCQLFQLENAVPARYVAFKVYHNSDGKAEISEFGAAAEEAKDVIIAPAQAEKLPTDYNVLAGLMPIVANNNGTTSPWEATDGVLCRVNVPASFTNQFGLGSAAAASPAKFHFDLGAEYSIDRLLFGNNGSDGGGYMCQSYKIYLGNDPDTLFSTTPVVVNNAADDSAKPAVLHQLATPVKARYIGYSVVGAAKDNMGRIGELAAYTSDRHAIHNTGDYSFRGMDTPENGEQVGDDVIFDLGSSQVMDIFRVHDTKVKVYASNLRNTLFDDASYLGEAEDEAIVLDDAITARYVAFRDASLGDAISFGSSDIFDQENADGNPDATTEQPDGWAQVLRFDDLLTGKTPFTLSASTGTLSAARVTDAQAATDGLVGGINAPVGTGMTGMTVKGSQNLVYKLDKRTLVEEINFAGTLLGSAQNTNHYTIYVSDLVEKLFTTQSKVAEFENKGDYTQLQNYKLSGAYGRYVGLAIEAGANDTVRVEEFDVFGTQKNDAELILHPNQANRLPTETSLIKGKTPCNADASVSNAKVSTDGVVYGIQAGKWRTNSDSMTVLTTANYAYLTYDLGSVKTVDKFLVDNCSLCGSVHDMLLNYSIFVGTDKDDLYNTTNRVASYRAATYSLAQVLTLDKPVMGSYVGFMFEVDPEVFTAYGGTHCLSVGELGVYYTGAASSDIISRGVQMRMEDQAIRFAASVKVTGDHKPALAGDTFGGKTVKKAGMNVALVEKMDGDSLRFTDTALSTPKGVVSVPANVMYETAPGYALFTVSVYDIPDDHMCSTIKALPYVVLSDDTVVYGEEMQTNQYLALMAGYKENDPVVHEKNETKVDFSKIKLTTGTFGSFRQVKFVTEYADGIARTGTIAIPDNVLEGDHWVYVTEFYGNQYAARDTTYALLAQGWYVVTLDGIGDTYGSAATVKIMKEFHDTLVNNFGLNEKCVPMGVSRGGLYAVNYANAYPDTVAGLYLDAPVQDICSWPGGNSLNGKLNTFNSQGKFNEPGTLEYRQYRNGGSRGMEWTGTGLNEWQGALKSYGITEDEALLYDRQSPVYNYDKLIKTDIKVLLQVSKSDTCVAYDENGYKLYKYFADNGEDAILVDKPEATINAMNITDLYAGTRCLMIMASDIPTSRDGRGGHTHGWHTPSDTAAYIIATMS